jgi:hypothetical protein
MDGPEITPGLPGGPAPPGPVIPSPHPAAQPRRRPPGTPKPIDRDKLAACLAKRGGVVARAESRKPPITRVLPVPRPVTLAGRTYLADELQLKDIAQIQGWLEQQTPHPLEGLPPVWADPEPATRPDRLRAAWTRAAAWPVRFGSPEAWAALDGDAGRLLLLHLTVGKADPDFGVADSAGLLPGIAPAEWSALLRVAFATTPTMELAAELDDSQRDPLRLTDWCEAFDLVHQHRVLSYREIGELYLSQWRNLNAVGKAVEMSADFGRSCARARARLGV